MVRESEIWKVFIETKDHGVLVRWANNELEGKEVLKEESDKAGDNLIYGDCYPVVVRHTKTGFVDFLNAEAPKYDNGKTSDIIQKAYDNREI